MPDVRPSAASTTCRMSGSARMACTVPVLVNLNLTQLSNRHLGGTHPPSSISPLTIILLFIATTVSDLLAHLAFFLPVHHIPSPGKQHSADLLPPDGLNRSLEQLHVLPVNTMLSFSEAQRRQQPLPWCSHSLGCLQHGFPDCTRSPPQPATGAGCFVTHTQHYSRLNVLFTFD